MNGRVLKWGLITGLAGLLFSAATAVYGLGLGNMDLQSRLNQRFSANIPVIVAADIDATDIIVKLANDAQFERAGLQLTSVAYQLQFTPERREDGKMVIAITSKSRVIEPVVSFVLEVEQGGTRTLRKYTALLQAPTI